MAPNVIWYAAAGVAAIVSGSDRHGIDRDAVVEAKR